MPPHQGAAGKTYPSGDWPWEHNFVSGWLLEGSREHGYIGYCPRCQTRRTLSGPAVDTRIYSIAEVEYLTCPSCAWRFYAREASGHFGETEAETARKAAREAARLYQQNEQDRLLRHKPWEEQEQRWRRESIAQLNTLAAEARRTGKQDLWATFRAKARELWEPSLAELCHLFDPETWPLVEHEACEREREWAIRRREREREEDLRRGLRREVRMLAEQATLDVILAENSATRQRIKQRVFSLLDTHGLEEVRAALKDPQWGRIVEFVSEWGFQRHPSSRFGSPDANPSEHTIFPQPPQLPRTYTYLAPQRKQRPAKIPGGMRTPLTLSLAAQYAQVSDHTIQEAVASGALESATVLATGERYVRKLWVTRWRKGPRLWVTRLPNGATVHDADEDDETLTDDGLPEESSGMAKSDLSDVEAEMPFGHDDDTVEPVVWVGDGDDYETVEIGTGFKFKQHGEEWGVAPRYSAGIWDWLAWLRGNRHAGLADLVEAVYIDKHSQTEIAQELGVQECTISRCLQEARYLIEQARSPARAPDPPTEPGGKPKNKVDGRHVRGNPGLQRVLAALEAWPCTSNHPATFAALKAHLGERSSNGLQLRLGKLMAEGRVEKDVRGKGYRIVRQNPQESSA